MKVLVTGGAGYVGSHTCLTLADAGHEVVVFDDLSTGHREAVQWGPLIEGSLAQPNEILAALQSSKPDVVMHFAAKSQVGESVTDPYMYFQNNVSGSLNLLIAMRTAGADKLVFSSTAAVYGEPERTPIPEDHPKAPSNPYGRSKLMIEWMLADAARSYGLRSVALRYFNAAGADPAARIGEDHEPESHLIPRLLRKAAGENLDVAIFGTDHATPDGTCIRDYVHVLDLASAHIKAMDLLQRESGFHAFNLGNAQGFSVREVVDAAEQVAQRSLNLPSAPRREGDPARLVASNAAAREVLGWKAQRAMTEILSDAWRWHTRKR